MAAWSPRPLEQDSFQPRPSPARRVLWEHPGWLGGGEETGEACSVPPGVSRWRQGPGRPPSTLPFQPPPACLRPPASNRPATSRPGAGCLFWLAAAHPRRPRLHNREVSAYSADASQPGPSRPMAGGPASDRPLPGFRGSPVVAPTLPQPGSGGQSSRAPGPRAATSDWSWPARALAGHRDAPALWLRLSRVIPSPARTRASSPEMTVWGRGRPRKCRACALIQPGPWWGATTPGHSHPGPASPGRGPAAQVWRPWTQGPCNPATLSLLQWLLPKVERGGE